MVFAILVISGAGEVFAADMLKEIRLNSQRGPLAMKDGEVVVVTQKDRSAFVFDAWNDPPPKGSMVTFRFKIESEENKGISYRFSANLKDGGSPNFLKIKKNLRGQKELQCEYSAVWDYDKQELSSAPKFSVMLWKKGAYKLSSFDYSYKKYVEGDTIYPNLNKTVSLEDEKIMFTGTKYVDRSSTHIEVSRFRKALFALSVEELNFSPTMARTTSGIVLKIFTDSPQVMLSWGVEAQYPGSVLDFGLVLDGVLQEKHFAARVTERKSPFSFTFETKAEKGRPRLCEITYPTHANPYLLGVKLNEGYDLSKPPRSNKKVYVAIGDSITHGTGQKGATHRTYAWQFAHKNNLELFNLAVGGGKVPLKVGEMLEDWTYINLVTILIGFNDCMGGGRSVDEYYRAYTKLLSEISLNHPEAKIVCISPTYPLDVKSKETGVHLNEFRKVVVKVVGENNAKGNANVYFLRGELLTSNNKGLHFSQEEAENFAEKLSQEIALRAILDYSFVTEGAVLAGKTD